ncbi:hypothetical protein BT93_L0417 [Corymbia citriodora subsp. variegata]|uniref:Phosphoinositide phospholipase C n=1 Tax=Corymbia citriodora subsp. variegata TaxID=360336 RepID=A0A8T0CPS7_CORYI|nr:hypothetical protein BT93_L0417 [Corymbia citriodora subsp. variegata]
MTSSNGSHNYKMFKYFNRKFKITEIEPPQDVKEAFRRFSDGGPHMGKDQLRRFLVEHQGEPSGAAASEAERVVEQALHTRFHLVPDHKQGLTLDDFFHYLLRDDLNGPFSCQVHHDMTAPLSHYFIYTGHNSYLTGNQLSSDCSDVPIIRALQRGVKVIELDMWPNSDKDDILILHGRTLTSPVTLVKCLKSIKEYAFVKSPYPVIITLEDHLTPELQAKVAEMATQIFGDTLYYPTAEYLAEFPSPESLKNRIIISTKPPKEFLESKSSKDKSSISPTGTHSSEDEAGGKETPDSTSEFDSDYRSESDQDCEDTNASHRPEYRRLITIHAGKPKGSLKEALRVLPDKVKRLSLSEHELEKATSSHGTDLVYSKEHFESVSQRNKSHFLKLQSPSRLDAWCSNGRIQYAGIREIALEDARDV